MPLRDFVLNNFRWKLTALFLAMLVWFVIKFAIYTEMTVGRNQVVRRLPVMVLKAPDDLRIYRLDVTRVDVVLRAKKELGIEDVEAFVDLTQMPEVNTALKQVLVRVPDYAKIVSSEPGFVLVERINPVDSSATNILKRP